MLNFLENAPETGAMSSGSMIIMLVVMLVVMKFVNNDVEDGGLM